MANSIATGGHAKKNAISTSGLIKSSLTVPETPIEIPEKRKSGRGIRYFTKKTITHAFNFTIQFEITRKQSKKINFSVRISAKKPALQRFKLKYSISKQFKTLVNVGLTITQNKHILLKLPISLAKPGRCLLELQTSINHTQKHSITAKFNRFILMSPEDIAILAMD